jgi:hypothetical protein
MMQRNGRRLSSSILDARPSASGSRQRRAWEGERVADSKFGVEDENIDNPHTNHGPAALLGGMYCLTILTRSVCSPRRRRVAR